MAERGTAAASLPDVMVLGCGRSGTSIFGELFDHLPRYSYVSEPPFSDVMAARGPGPAAFKVPRESDGFPPTPGLSFPLDSFLRAKPNATLFWIVRHPLDAICSLRIGIAKSWGHHPRPPDWRDWLHRPLLERCAHHWTYINAQGFGHVEDRATLVRFEDMIADPAAFAESVCRAVGLPLAEAAEAVAAWSGRVQDTNNERFVEAKTSRGYSRPDHAVRVGRWRENLTPEEAGAVWRMVGDTAERFGYRFTV
ncbi:MAG: sulfotransferase [Minwuiales bacterium]|nr:sulfotransferase [Minwuiales bacterium]